MNKTAWKEKAIRLMLLATASTSILIVIGIFVFLGKEAGPFATDPGLKELLGSRWIPVSFQRESFGILPLVTGSVLAILLTIPFGVGANFRNSLSERSLRSFPAFWQIGFVLALFSGATEQDYSHNSL